MIPIGLASCVDSRETLDLIAFHEEIKQKRRTYVSV